MGIMSKCRSCGEPLHHTCVDLGMSPLCESYINGDALNKMEPFFPLKVNVCDKCYLVQLDEYVSPEEIFAEYAYFSSYSEDWLKHAQKYVNDMVVRLGLDHRSFVVEIASNDGYLLQYFCEKKIPVLGIEPAKNVAKVAEEKGVHTLVKFFGVQTAAALAKEEKLTDLLIGNNVLAQVPDLNDFVGGMKILLKPKGVITMEFPHLTKLIKENQFDTIYHEHFSYFSLYTSNIIFNKHGLKVFDVDEIPTHGGSLRIFACHSDDNSKEISQNVKRLLLEEETLGVNTLAYYQSFQEQVQETKRKLLDFLIDAKRMGKAVVGYGAPGKGNTLLNYCGIRTDFLDYTVDRNPYKQGMFLPGTHIPIYPPEKINETKPDYVLILPWNFKDEIIKQMKHIDEWGGKFVVPIPEVKVLS